MADTRASFEIWRRLVSARMRADWQYRTSFFLFLAAQLVASAADFGAIAVLFTRIHSLGGWSIGQVAFLYGASGIAFGLADLFISPVEYASVHIRAGSFDQFLTRPVGPLWQLCGSEFALRRIGRLLQPTVVLAIAMSRTHVDWTPARALLLPVSILAGAAIYGSIWVMTSSVSFWAVESQEFAAAFTYGGSTLTSYPVDVFGRWLRGLVTFALPLASVAYLPGALLFGKPRPFGLPSWVGWTGPLVALVWVLLARATWRTALRHHRSTGS